MLGSGAESGMQPSSVLQKHYLFVIFFSTQLLWFALARNFMAEQSLVDLLPDNPDLTNYETLYKHFHSHPELSLQERETASTIASHLESVNAGYEIHTSIGGHGLVGVIKNGPGSTVLLRADMDGLPVLELTGLPYASKVTMKDVADGIEKPVMHACGHDMHVTCLLAAAERLGHIKHAWSGTLIVLFQPNEERGGGAQAMVEDGLYDKIPVPDYVLGQHVLPLRAGRVYVFPEFMFPLLNPILSLETCLWSIYSLDMFSSSPYPLKQAELTPK